MDFNSILTTVKDYVPIPVIVGVVIVIMLVYGSLYLASLLEEKLESKYQREIKIFDRKEQD